MVMTTSLPYKEYEIYNFGENLNKLGNTSVWPDIEQGQDTNEKKYS